MPSLDATRALGARALGDEAVEARWSLGDGRVLAIAASFGETAVAATAPAATCSLWFESRPGVARGLRRGVLDPQCTVAWEEPAPSAPSLPEARSDRRPTR